MDSSIKPVEARILHLPLKKKWFEMIAAGVKTEEYRSLSRFYCSRLQNGLKRNTDLGLDKMWLEVDWKKYDVVEFRNGYGNNVPKLVVEFKGVEVRGGNPDWGAIAGEEYFVIKLGKVLIETYGK